MPPGEHPAELPHNQMSVADLIKTILQDGKVDGDDLVKLQEIQKRFEQDKSELGAQIKTELAKAKTEMLERGFTIANEKDYDAFLLVAKMAGKGEKFPTYSEVLTVTKSTYSHGQKISVYFTSGKLWAYNFNEGYYAWFDTENGKISTDLGMFSVGLAEFKTSDNNTMDLPKGLIEDIQKLDTQKALKIVGLKNIINETIQKAKDTKTDTERVAKITETNGYISQLAELGVDVQIYKDELAKIPPIVIKEASIPTVVTLNNKGPVKLSDKTKAVLTGLVVNPESPTMSELTAIFKKYVDNTNLYNGKDSSITSDDHIRITYAVQLALNHINGGGDLQIDGARGPKSSQAIKNFQKSVGFKESNPDEPAKVTDGIPGAATIAEILKKLETSPAAVS